MSSEKYIYLNFFLNIFPTRFHLKYFKLNDDGKIADTLADANKIDGFKDE